MEYREYWEEHYCPICKRNTLQYYESMGHERDVSGDYQECLYCRARSYGGWGKNWKPREQEYTCTHMEFSLYLWDDVTGTQWLRIGQGIPEYMWLRFKKTDKKCILLHSPYKYKWPIFLTEHMLKNNGDNFYIVKRKD